MPASMTRERAKRGSLTAKHFEALAAALKENRPALPEDGYGQPYHFSEAQWSDCAGRIASVCARFNPNFDRARFLAACGVQEG